MGSIMLHRSTLWNSEYTSERNKRDREGLSIRLEQNLRQSVGLGFPEGQKTVVRCTVAVALSIGVLTACFRPQISFADDTSASSVAAVGGQLVRTSPITEKLTASSIIKSDLEFYFKELQDMYYVLSQVDKIIEDKDYESVRGILRQEPLRTLRKTSKTLQKFLPSKELQEKYQASYAQMIDAVDELDFLATSRIRKEGVPKEGQRDSKVLEVLGKATKHLGDMLALVPK